MPESVHFGSSTVDVSEEAELQSDLGATVGSSSDHCTSFANPTLSGELSKIHTVLSSLCSRIDRIEGHGVPDAAEEAVPYVPYTRRRTDDSTDASRSTNVNHFTRTQGSSRLGVTELGLPLNVAARAAHLHERPELYAGSTFAEEGSVVDAALQQRGSQLTDLESETFAARSSVGAIADSDVSSSTGVQNMKLAVVFSEGLSDEDRKVFFDLYFDFASDPATAADAFELGMKALNEGKSLRRHEPPVNTIEALKRHDELEALKSRAALPPFLRGTASASMIATTGSRTHSEYAVSESNTYTRDAEAPKAVPDSADDDQQAVFEALKGTIYREVAVFIAYNETRPNFLVNFFRMLQCLTSDYLRQQALDMLNEMIQSADLADADTVHSAHTSPGRHAHLARYNAFPPNISPFVPTVSVY